MTKIITTCTRILEVRQNADNTLFITENGTDSIENAGQFILNLGGIDKVLARCIDTDLSLSEYRAKIQAEKKALHEVNHQKAMERQAEAEQRIKAEYEALLAENSGIIPTTYENIGKVLRYLNLQNWGGWQLPIMTIGYRCNQYDCDGKTASTMILDEPIDITYEDERTEGYIPNMVSKFQVGAPHGHLTQYHRA